MYCPKCGAKNYDDQIFCGTCGARLKSLEVELSGLSPADLSERVFIQRKLKGKFEIRQELGRGGFGVVYEAFDIMLNRQVAVKALHLTQSGEKQVVKRFIKEARLAAQLDHSNIVRIYTIDSAGPVHFFIMEYIDGKDIKKKIKSDGPFSPEETVRICKDIASALAYAHTKGIVHRDIKPHNIILKYGEIPVITDFGIAKALDSEATQLTSGALGSPHYISPEQLLNKPVDPRADQYSLGAMMYEMLTGKPMFTGSGMVILHKQISEKPTPIRDVNPDIPESLAGIVHRLLEKDRDRRYPKCSDVVRALTRLRRETLTVSHDMSQIKPFETSELQQNLKSHIRNALRRKKYDLAIRLAERGKSNDPGDSEFATFLREAKEHQAKAGKAKGFINEGIERFHDKQYTQAIEKWEQALELDDSNTDLPKFIERARRLREQRRKAREYFDEALNLLEKKEYTKALEKFRFIKKFDSEWPGIDDFIRKAETAESESAELRKMLEDGHKMRKANRLQEAIDLFQRILERDPDHAQARKGLEQTVQDMNRFEEIKKLQDRWSKFYKKGLFGKALESLERLQTLCPDKRDEFQKHIDEIRNQQAVGEKVERLKKQARKAHEDRRFQQAFDLWKEACLLKPEDTELAARKEEAQKAVALAEDAESKIKACRRALANGNVEKAEKILEHINTEWVVPESITKLKRDLRTLQDRKKQYHEQMRQAIRNKDIKKAGQILSAWKKDFPADQAERAFENELKAAGKKRHVIEKQIKYVTRLEQKGDVRGALIEARKLNELHPEQEMVEALIGRLEKKIHTEKKDGSISSKPLLRRGKLDGKTRSEKIPEPPRPRGKSIPAATQPESRKKSKNIMITFFVVILLGIAGIHFLIGGEHKRDIFGISADMTVPAPTPVHTRSAPGVYPPHNTRIPVVTATPHPAMILPTKKPVTKSFASPTAVTAVVVTPTALPSVQPTATPEILNTISVPTAPPSATLRSVLSESDVQKIASYLKAAQFRMEKKQYRSALDAVESALTVDPFDNDSLKLKKIIQDVLNQSDRSLRKARLLYAQGDFTAARKVLGEVLTWDPQNQNAQELMRKLHEVDVQNTPTESAAKIDSPEVLKVDFPKSVRETKDVGIPVIVFSKEGLKSARLFYKTDQYVEWYQAKAEKVKSGKRKITFVIPGEAVKGSVLYVYLRLEDTYGRLGMHGSADTPETISIKPARRLPLGGM